VHSRLLLYDNCVKAAPDNITERWLTSLGPEEILWLDRSPIRRDVVTLLKYCRDHQVRGTANTGNFPRKMVHDLLKVLVNLSPFDRDEFTISHLRSEDDIQYIHFLHYLADLSGFLTGGPAQPIQTTADAESFLALMAPLQVAFLLFMWWNFMDWQVTKYEDEGSKVLPVIKRSVYRMLVSQEVNKKVDYEKFLKQLMEMVDSVRGFETKKPSDYIHDFMIENMVMEPLADMAVLKADFQPHPTLGLPFEKLISIQVTPLGRTLLKNMLLVKAEDILPPSSDS
jgi:hypothetical protein